MRFFNILLLIRGQINSWTESQNDHSAQASGMVSIGVFLQNRSFSGFIWCLFWCQSQNGQRKNKNISFLTKYSRNYSTNQHTQEAIQKIYLVQQKQISPIEITVHKNTVKNSNTGSCILLRKLRKILVFSFFHDLDIQLPEWYLDQIWSWFCIKKIFYTKPLFFIRFFRIFFSKCSLEFSVQ